MVIAVNTRFLLVDRLEGYGYFIKEVFNRIAQAHPEHQFYFLFDRPFSPSYIEAPNIKGLVVPPAARHPILWRYWYDLKIPLALRKIKADLFVSPDGFASLYTSVPQCMIVHDLGFLHHPEAYRESHVQYYKRQTPKYLKKVRSIGTVSQFSREDLIKQYRVKQEKLSVVYSACREIYGPPDERERDRIKQQYTEGREFFIYVGAIHPRKNLVNLLKAFSIFKKRQQSEMKLVLAGRLAWKNDEFLKLLNTYKYRQDVILTGYVEEEELVKLTGSAYALVYPSVFEGFGVPVLEAMRCHVPVLTSKNTSMEEIAGDAGLYFNPQDPADVGDKLMRIYKDEDLRRLLIKKGIEKEKKYSWARTAELVWECMERAVANSR
jgi:glycosyltransferase involved in cell wall biosynthesis